MTLHAGSLNPQPRDPACRIQHGVNNSGHRGALGGAQGGGGRREGKGRGREGGREKERRGGGRGEGGGGGPRQGEGEGEESVRAGGGVRA